MNKVLPDYLRDAVGQAGPVDVRRGRRLAEGLSDDPVVAARVLGEVAESFLNFGVVARREAEQQAELRGAPDILVTVPFFGADIFDMGGLLQLGAQVWDYGGAGRRVPCSVMSPAHRSRSPRVRRRAHHRPAGAPRRRSTPRPRRTSPPGG